MNVTQSPQKMMFSFMYMCIQVYVYFKYNMHTYLAFIMLIISIIQIVTA